MLRQLTRSMGPTSRLLRQVNYGTNAPAGTHIPVTKALEIGQWEEKLKAAGVEDRKFNVKCIVSHVLKQKFVSICEKSWLSTSLTMFTFRRVRFLTHLISCS